MTSSSTPAALSNGDVISKYESMISTLTLKMTAQQDEIAELKRLLMQQIQNTNNSSNNDAGTSQQGSNVFADANDSAVHKNRGKRDGRRARRGDDSPSMALKKENVAYLRTRSRRSRSESSSSRSSSSCEKRDADATVYSAINVTNPTNLTFASPLSILKSREGRRRSGGGEERGHSADEDENANVTRFSVGSSGVTAAAPSSSPAAFVMPAPFSFSSSSPAPSHSAHRRHNQSNTTRDVNDHEHHHHQRHHDDHDHNALPSSSWFCLSSEHDAAHWHTLVEEMVKSALRKHMARVDEKIAMAMAERVRRVTREHVIASVDREFRRMRRQSVFNDDHPFNQSRGLVVGGGGVEGEEVDFDGRRGGSSLPLNVSLPVTATDMGRDEGGNRRYGGGGPDDGGTRSHHRHRHHHVDPTIATQTHQPLSSTSPVSMPHAAALLSPPPPPQQQQQQATQASVLLQSQRVVNDIQRLKALMSTIDSSTALLLSRGGVGGGEGGAPQPIPLQPNNACGDMPSVNARRVASERSFSSSSSPSAVGNEPSNVSLPLSAGHQHQVRAGGGGGEAAGVGIIPTAVGNHQKQKLRQQQQHIEHNDAATKALADRLVEKAKRLKQHGMDMLTKSAGQTTMRMSRDAVDDDEENNEYNDEVEERQAGFGRYSSFAINNASAFGDDSAMASRRGGGPIASTPAATGLYSSRYGYTHPRYEAHYDAGRNALYGYGDDEDRYNADGHRRGAAAHDSINTSRSGHTHTNKQQHATTTMGGGHTSRLDVSAYLAGGGGNYATNPNTSIHISQAAPSQQQGGGGGGRGSDHSQADGTVNISRSSALAHTHHANNSSSHSTSRQRSVDVLGGRGAAPQPTPRHHSAVIASSGTNTSASEMGGAGYNKYDADPAIVNQQRHRSVRPTTAHPSRREGKGGTVAGNHAIPRRDGIGMGWSRVDEDESSSSGGDDESEDEDYGEIY